MACDIVGRSLSKTDELPIAIVLPADRLDRVFQQIEAIVRGNDDGEFQGSSLTVKCSIRGLSLPDARPDTPKRQGLRCPEAVEEQARIGWQRVLN